MIMNNKVTSQQKKEKISRYKQNSLKYSFLIKTKKKNLFDKQRKLNEL